MRIETERRFNAEYDIADLVLAVEAKELDGWVLLATRYGYDAEYEREHDSGYYVEFIWEVPQ